MKERIRWIDSAKGILIILLIIHHIARMISNERGYGLSNVLFLNADEFNFKTFVSFFMPSFFIISGMCTNFDKDFKSFLHSTALTLILPAAILCGTQEWFIMALFIDRILYWLINRKINNNTLILLIMLFSLFLSSLLSTYYSEYERLNLYHVLGSLPFLYFGHRFKNMFFENKLFLLISSITYLFVTALLILYNSHVPFLTRLCEIYVHEIPLHILLAITGTGLILLISRYLDNKYLAFIGRMSLVYYLTHMFFLKQIVSRICDTIEVYDGNAIMSLFIYLILVVSALILCTIAAKLFDTKVGRYFMGR